jgi:hypothetical protein
MSVVISKESKRGCGFRKPSKGGVGIYLMGPSISVACGRLPFRLEACPCCGGGIKPTRGFTWFEPQVLIGPVPEPTPMGCGEACRSCPMGRGMPEGKHGLLWIGGGYYKKPIDFMMEAQRMGISRKLPAVPRDFVLGETVVYLAHREAVSPLVCSPGSSIPCVPKGTPRNADGTVKDLPGIFTVFKPTGIDLVIEDENNVPERAQKLQERLQKQLDEGKGSGEVQLVKVIPVGEQADLPLGDKPWIDPANCGSGCGGAGEDCGDPDCFDEQDIL